MYQKRNNREPGIKEDSQYEAESFRPDFQFYKIKKEPDQLTGSHILG
jgi:hypothetical protein